MKQKKEFENRLKLLMKECVCNLQDLSIKVSKNIEGIYINTRAKKRLGCCKMTRSGLKSKYSIEVSYVLIEEDDEFLKDIIYHELLHTVAGCMNHGKKWKKAAALVNNELGTNIKSRTDYFKHECDTEKLNYKYGIKCIKCGSMTYRLRSCNLTKHPECYKCAKCGGSLDVKVL